MALTEDYTLEVVSRSMIAGVSTQYIVQSEPGPVGFSAALPDVQVQDQQTIGDGAAFGNDTYGPRILAFTVGTMGPTDVEARQQADALTMAWRRGAAQLDVRLPGSPETVMSYFGRPRGLVNGSDWFYDQGYLAAALEFFAEPFPYGAAQTLLNQSGTFTLPDDDTGHGGIVTRRMTVTVNANGGTPVLAMNATDIDGHTYSRDITFTAPVSSDVTLDLFWQTATQSTDNDAIGLTANTSWWPELIGGVDNVWTVSGCAGVDITWRPAYY